MGEKTPHTVKFSKFFTSLLSYAGLLGPSILTLHILNLTLNSDIPIPPMDVSRVEIKDETIEPKFLFFPDLKKEEKDEDNEGEEDDGEEGEEEEGETDEDEEISDPVEEEQQELEEPKPEEKQEEEKNNEEPESPKEDEGPKFLKEDGKLDYDVVAAWARNALEEYNKNKV